MPNAPQPPSEIDSPDSPAEPTSMTRRSAWLLLAVAIGVAPFVAGSVASDALSWLMTHLVNALDIENDYKAIKWLRLTIHFPLPIAVTFGILYFSPLGRWLAVTPLTTMLFLAGDAGLTIGLLDRTMEFGLRAGLVTLWMTLGDVFVFVVQALLCLAVATLVMATVWYRCIAFIPRWAAACRRLLEEH